MKTKTDEVMEEHAELQLAPFIDCILFLLFFFLAASTMQKPHKQLDIQLPNSAAAKEKATRNEAIIFQLSREGGVYYDNQEMTKQSLHKLIRESATENPNREVRIDADRQVASQHLVYLLDLLQFEGLNKVAIRTLD